MNRFEKVRKEKRGGKAFKRSSTRDRRNQIVLRRLQQAEDQHQRCKSGILPYRDRPLLRHPYQPYVQDGETDSEFAETVWISSESEEEETTDPSGVWADPVSSARTVLVSTSSVRPVIRPTALVSTSSVRPVIRPAVPQTSSARPVIRPAVPQTPSVRPVIRPAVPKASSVRPVVIRPAAARATSARPTAVTSETSGIRRTTSRPVQEAWDQAFAGTLITPSGQRVKFSGELVVSLDWHQVLDVKRHSRGTDRPSPPYTLLPEYEQLIRGLKDRGVVVLVCSYTCSPVYRDQVQSLAWKYPRLFDHIIITTEKRCREGGELSALQSITHLGSCKMVHFDDSEEVIEELESYRAYRGWLVGHPVGVTAVGIKVLRRPQFQGPRYFKNLGEALAQLDTEHLSRRLAEFTLDRRTDKGETR